MNPYGSDRLRENADGTLLLQSRLDKGWQPRVERTLTSAEYPGTAVLWDDQYFEVADMQRLPQDGGIRYLLVPWKNEHVMRISERYDAASEEQRLADHLADRLRTQQRKSVNVLGMFTGHLPAVVQEHLGSELGVLPIRLTLVSLILPIVMAGLFVFRFVGILIDEGTIRFALLIPAIYFLVETSIRSGFALSQSRPIGSPLGFLGYLVFYLCSADRSRLVAPFTIEKGLSTSSPIAAPDEVALRDSLTMREPLFTLLPVADQQRLAATFGYDHRGMATTIAVVILVFAGAGLISSIRALMHGLGHVTTVLSMLVAAFLLVEQCLRLAALQRGPAGSVLGYLIRPFLKKWLR